MVVGSGVLKSHAVCSMELVLIAPLFLLFQTKEYVVPHTLCGVDMSR